MNKTPIDKIETAENARQIAIDWQNSVCELKTSLNELIEWQNYFEDLANKFPELREEFIENAII